jgi:hypothetical protein
MALSLTGGRAASCRTWSDDGTVRLWDVATGQPRGAPMLVDCQAAVVMPAEECIGIRRDVRHHWLMAPQRVADEMLKLLGAAPLPPRQAPRL